LQKRKTDPRADRVHQWLIAAQVAIHGPRLNALRSVDWLSVCV
jgi:hypothetical protein